MVKRMVVIGLERVCDVADQVPGLRRVIGCGGLISPATVSLKLDHRWHTGAWRVADDEGED